MNSVMEIGENILFKNGLKAWKEQKKKFSNDNQDVIDFVYSSNLFKSQRSLE
jgi:phospholipid/cholesterol/gamma-HCH transport system ATP-binding protein